MHNLKRLITRQTLAILVLLLLSTVFTTQLPVVHSDDPSPRWVESDDPLVNQMGTWSPVVDELASGGSYLVNSSTGQDAALTFSFDGNALEIIYVTGPDYGVMAIEVDGSVLRTVNTQFEDSFHDVRATIDYLDGNDTHVLRVFPVSGVIAVDAFFVKVVDAPVAMPETEGTSESAVLGNPNGNIYSASPRFNWTNNNGVVASWFRLEIKNQGTGQIVYNKWSPGDPVNCTGSVCSFNDPAISLSSGTYEWRVQLYHGTTTTPFSPKKTFVVQIPDVIDPQGLRQAQTEQAGNLKYSWEPLSLGEQWYELLIYSGNNTSLLWDDWYSQADFCVFTPTPKCEVNPSDESGGAFALSGNGNYNWYLRVWGPDGYGPWTLATSFTLDVEAPGGPTFIGSPGDGEEFTNSFTPEFFWEPVQGATWYNVIVMMSSGTTVYNRWYSSQQVGCYTNPFSQFDDCEVFSPYLANGNYNFFLGVYGPGTGNLTNMQYSDAVPFIMDVELADPPTLIPISNPNGNYNRGDVTYQWQDIDIFPEIVEWYNLIVTGPSGYSFNAWYANQDICDGGICSVLNTNLAPKTGLYHWWVQGWNTARGFSPWSGEGTYTIPTGTVGTPNQNSFIPDGINPETNSRLTYKWDEVTNATWYNLYLLKNGVTAVNLWFRRTTDLNCDNTVCFVLPNLDLTNGTYTMYVGAWGPQLGATPAKYNSQPRTFTVQGPAITAFSSPDPANASTKTTPNFDFSWADGAGLSYYEFYLGRVANGQYTQIVYGIYTSAPDQPTPDSVTCGNPNPAGTCVFTLDPSILLSSGTYEWWMRAGGATGNTGWVKFSTFTVDLPSPVAPTQVAPADDEIIGSKLVTYEWQTVEYSEWYNLELTSSTGQITSLWYFIDDVCDESGDCAVTLGRPSGLNKWRVRAYSLMAGAVNANDGYGAWSALSEFTKLVRIN